MTILTLPPELFHVIYEYLDDGYDGSALIESCRAIINKFKQIGTNFAVNIEDIAPCLVPDNYFIYNIYKNEKLEYLIKNYPNLRIRMNIRKFSPQHEKLYKMIHCVAVDDYHPVEPEELEILLKYENIKVCNFKCEGTHTYDTRKNLDEGWNLNVTAKSDYTFDANNIKFLKLSNCKNIKIRGCSKIKTLYIYKSENVDIDYVSEINIWMSKNVDIDKSNSVSIENSSNVKFNKVKNLYLEGKVSDITGEFCGQYSQNDFDKNIYKNISIKKIEITDIMDISHIKDLCHHPKTYSFDGSIDRPVKFIDHDIEGFYMGVYDSDGDNSKHTIEFRNCPKFGQYFGGLQPAKFHNCPELRRIIHVNDEDTYNAKLEVSNCYKLESLYTNSDFVISGCPQLRVINDIARNGIVHDCPNIEELHFAHYSEAHSLILLDTKKYYKKQGQIKLDLPELPKLRVIKIMMKNVPLDYILSKTKNPVQIFIEDDYQQFYKGKFQRITMYQMTPRISDQNFE